MKDSYTFYGIELKRYILMFVCAFLGLALILQGIILGEAITFLKDRLEFSTLYTIVYSIGGLLIFIFLFLIADKMAFLYADEKWIISFDSKEIEISSNRRSKKIFPISQLKEFVFFRSNQSSWIIKKTVRIRFQFKEKGIFPQYIIHTNKFIFSNSIRKNSYKISNQFLDSFYKQVLQSKFEQKRKDKSFYFYLR